MKDKDRNFFGKLNKRLSLKDNNSGFTLLELLIAVLILAVVMAPMLNSFVVNARVNRKAKIKLRSTMIAQDLMEGLKGYSTKDIYKQFSGEEPFRLIANRSLSTPAEVSANTVIATADPDGLSYVYYLKGLEYQGFKYDAVLSINGAPYKAAGGKINLSGNSLDYNDKVLANISTMDNSYDGIFMSDNEEVRKVMESDLESKKEDALSCPITRTFDITLSKNGVTAKGNTKQLCNVKVSYEAVSGPSVYASSIRDFTAYNNVDIVDDGCSIRSIYFFYYPAYGSNYTDIINFTNEDKIPVTLYILQQKTTDPDILANLYSLELAYRPKVNIVETGSSYGTKKTKVCTNLTTSLYNGEPKSPPPIIKFNGTNPVSLNDIIEPNVVEELAVNRMFDAFVSVYDAGAADETPAFPDRMLLTRIDGSKINH